MTRQRSYYDEPHQVDTEDWLTCDTCHTHDERPVVDLFGSRTLCVPCRACEIEDLESQLHEMAENDMAGTSEYKRIENLLNELS